MKTLNSNSVVNRIKSSFGNIKIVSKGLVAGILVLSFVMTMEACNKDKDVTANTEQVQKLKVDMRQLWAEHMEWTYATVDAFFHDANGLNAKLNRLLKNQTDIGEAVKPFYGASNGDKLAQLLTEHIQLAVPVLTAAKDGNNAALETALDDWYANAQAVGDHFAAMNPEHWEQPVLRDMWKTHITQTVTYSVDLLQNELEKAVVDYQDAYNHMMGMGDIMSDGIVKSFPEKF